MSRRERSPARTHPKSLPKFELQPEKDQPLLPYDAACILLYLGTTVFPVAVVLLNTCPLGAPAAARLLTCLLSYSCIILAFIGGIQQAAAVSGSEPPVPVSAREWPALVVPVAAIGLTLIGWVTLSVAQYRGIAPSDLLVMSCLYAGQACLESAHPRWQQLPPRVLMQQARRLPMVTAALCMAAASHAAVRIAPFSLGRAGTAYSAAELGLLLLSAVLVAAAVVPRSPKTQRAPSSPSLAPSWSPSYERPPVAPAKFGHVAVGSTNVAKVAAVRKALRSFPAVAPLDAPLLPFGVASGIAEQPIGLALTAEGARNRAVAAYAEACRVLPPAARQGAVLALGIESGIFEVSGVHYDGCFVSAYDGSRHHLGLSCAFEVPPRILKLMLTQGMDMAQASNVSGISQDPKLGQGEGLIGVLSRGRVRSCVDTYVPEASVLYVRATRTSLLRAVRPEGPG